MTARTIWIPAGILIALLVALNIQLLVDDDGGPQTARQATVPALPDDAGGTSSDAVTRELDALTGDLQTPLKGLRKDLRDATRSSSEPLRRIGPELAMLARGSAGIQDALRSLQATGSELRQLTTVTRDLPAATAELRRLRAATRALPQLVREVRALRRQTSALTAGVPNLAGQLDATRAGLAEIATTLKTTNAALDRAAKCLRRPIICD